MLKATHVIPMLPVLTMKVLLSVNVMLGILEMDLVVQVRKCFVNVSEIFYFIYSLSVSYLCNLF